MVTNVFKVVQITKHQKNQANILHPNTLHIKKINYLLPIRKVLNNFAK